LDFSRWVGRVIGLVDWYRTVEQLQLSDSGRDSNVGLEGKGKKADAGCAVDVEGKEENHQITRTQPVTTTYHKGQMTDVTVNSSDGKTERVESRYVYHQAFTANQWSK
jgi:hypothetical protein